MARKTRQVRFNFWSILGKIGKIRQLIETVVALVKYVQLASDDVRLKKYVADLDSLLDDILR